MKYFFFLIILAEAAVCNGQSDMFSTSGNQANALTLEAYDIAGKRIPTGNQAAIEGNQMLNENYETGVVLFKNGHLYKNAAINFSLANDALYFKKDSMELAFADPVEQFALPVKDEDKVTTFFFKSGYPGIDKQTNKSFYQVLTSGPRLELLKYKHKIVREPYTYGGPVRKEYATDDRLYIYDSAGNRMFSIKPGINSVKKSLPAYQNDIEVFVSQNKANLKREEEIKQLIDYINKQPG